MVGVKQKEFLDSVFLISYRLTSVKLFYRVVKNAKSILQNHGFV